MFYPMMVNIKNKKITIFGGGRVAYRKAKKILEYGGKVKIVSPNMVDDFNYIRDYVEFTKDKYNKGHLEGSFLVVAATSNKSVNKTISKDCKDRNILCNVVDDINISDYIVPSSIRRGDLVISVSTGGKSPSLSSRVRRELEEKYDDSYDEYIKILGDIRKIVISKCHDDNKRRKIFKEIINLSLEELKDRRIEYENSSRI